MKRLIILMAIGLVCPADIFAQPQPFSVTEISLGKLLNITDPIARIASPDNRHFAYIANIGGKAAVVIDGKQGPVFDSILKRSLSFSPDSQQQLVYAGKRNGKLYLVLNGSETELSGELAPPFFSSNPLFSPDGKHLAYILNRAGKALVVRDGTDGATYDKIVSTAFSPDSQKLVYPASVGTDSFMVLDGVAGKKYSGVSPPQFSPDSKQLFYSASLGGGTFLVTNETEGKAYEMFGGITVSPDGKHVAHQAVNSQKMILVVRDGIEGKGYEGGTSSPIRFSPDSQHIAYVASHGNNLMFVVLDATEQKEYPVVIDTRFSPDSTKLAYRTRKNASHIVVVNGVEGPGFKSIYDESITFSPDSQRLAFRATVGTQEVIVVNGKSGMKFRATGNPLFSKDSKHLAYAAADNKGWRLVIDEKSGQPYEFILNKDKLKFDDSGVLSFVALRKGEAFRVEVRPQN